MQWKGKSRRTVFILGAGATRGAVPHVVLNRKQLKPPLNSDFFSVLETFVRAVSPQQKPRARYDRLKRALREDFPTRGEWPLPMETAFSLLYVSKDFPEIYAKGPGRRRQAGSRAEIEDFLRLTFGVLTAIERNARPNNLYSSLVTHVDPEDTIVTLNYDTVLDSALIYSGWRPETGYALIGGAHKTKWVGSKPPASDQLAHVKLLKLHGSLNWFVRGSFKNLPHVFDAKPSRILIARRPRTNESRKFMRQIIPPIYGKFFNHSHWQRLWQRAYEAILEAEVVVVIGCSLVNTDFHLYGMLGHAIRVRTQRNRPFEYAIVADTTRVRRKWHRLLKGNHSLSYPNFARFVAALG